MKNKMKKIKHKPMLGYEDQYLISVEGDVWSIKNKKYLYLNNTGKGYLQFYACKDSTKVPKLVHRVVAQTFIRPIKPNEEVNHRDKNNQNNSLKNIQILTKDQHKKFHKKKKETENEHK